MKDQIILRDCIMCRDENGVHRLRKIDKEERYDDLIDFIKEHKKITMELLNNDLIVCVTKED